MIVSIGIIGKICVPFLTEKLDGENTCLNKHGFFVRSHAAPTQSLWTKAIRQYWQLIHRDLGGIELFGENL